MKFFKKHIEKEKIQMIIAEIIGDFFALVLCVIAIWIIKAYLV